MNDKATFVENKFWKMHMVL